MKRERRLTLAWLLPIASIALAGWLGYSAWLDRGSAITITFDDGHGLKPGDEVRYRGIVVGLVDQIRLAPDSRTVVVEARLEPSASHLARSGTLFWIVRPEVGLSGVSGLDTLVGPRYLAVEPVGGGAHRLQASFVGLAAPPVVLDEEPGDLEIVLEGDTRAGLVRGAPVSYRDMRIGTVRSVGLSSDGGIVEVRAHIGSAYTDLIRENTRFWSAGGVRAQIGITGMFFELDSLEGLLTGSVSLAVPAVDAAGSMVRTGHRFQLHSEPEDEWLEWRPSVAIGHSLLPPGAPMPSPLRARLTWTQGRIFRGDRARQGWALQIEGGLLAPLDLFVADEKAREGTAALEVAGASVSVASEPDWHNAHLALRNVAAGTTSWSVARLRTPVEPEDGIVVADTAEQPLSLSASRFSTEDEGLWKIDAAISIERNRHGAVFLSRDDGLIIGVVLIDEDDQAHIAPITAGLLQALTG